MAEKGRSPDYRLKLYDRDLKKGGDAGAAWVNEDGSISITLNIGIVLQERDGLSINLFKNEPYDPAKRRRRDEGYEG
jgi:hypothetical protein